MKKSKYILIAMIVMLTAAISAGCASAYDVAVMNGYPGTEQQWLESLKGKDGSDGKNVTIDEIYEKALESGFEGSYLEFLDRYFASEVGTNSEAAITKGLRSAVEVYCTFQKQSFTGQTNVTQGGAGVIYKLGSANGSAYIITNYHVVYSESNKTVSKEIVVKPYGGKKISAQYIGGTPDYDIAVLKAEDQSLKDDFFKAADVNTSDVTVGQTAIAIGNPSGAGISATKGIVSVDSEYITMQAIDNSLAEVTMRVMRIDAAVNSGNSGGGLFNDNGEFIGVVNAKSGDNDIENVGYAIPASIAISVAQNILRNGEFVKGLAGVTLAAKDSKAQLDANGRVTIVEKVVVDAVSDAAEGILKKGDVIQKVEVLDTVVTPKRTFNVIDAVLRASPGDEVTFTVLRNGESMAKTVVLKRPSS